MTTPDFLTFSNAEEELLTIRLRTVRAVIAHAGEKGASLETEAIQILRGFLPAEYGLTTGFIAYKEGNDIRLSTQLDIIIYDSLRSGPIARLGSCDVLPLEAVYAYVEVKASLCSSSDEAKSLANNSIERCIELNRKIRSPTQRRFWSTVPGSPNMAVLVEPHWLGVRSYVFAFSADGAVANDPILMAKRIANYSKKIGAPAHFHGVFVAGSAFYMTLSVDVNKAKPTDYYRVQFTASDPLARFKWCLLHDLSRFPRYPSDWAPAIDQYSPTALWEICAPDHE